MVNAFESIINLALKYSYLLIINSAGTKKEILSYVEKTGFSSTRNIPKIEQVDLWQVANIPDNKLKLGNSTVPALFPNSDPVLLLLSTVEPRKGHKEIIEAAVHAWNQGVKFNLIFIGRLGWITEEFLTNFDSFLKSNVSRALWLNDLSDEKMEMYLSGVDLLVSPSLGEGYGLPVVEALNRNIPVLANAIPPYKELFSSHAVLYGHDERFKSLNEALLELSQVLNMGEKLLQNNPLPVKDTVGELLDILSS
jgi:glycosyltransferase involved in cell wall biosynthesis